MNLIYEKYHSRRSGQKRVINGDDFTYVQILSFLRDIGIKDKKIMDIGCGVGTIDFYLAKNGANVTGIDISRNAISIAKKNAENLGLGNKIKFEVVDFPKGIIGSRFDVVICSEVLEHLKEDTLAVSRIKSLLSKDGIVIASSPSKNAPLYKMGLLKRFDKEVGHLRRYTPKRFVSLFKSRGFNVTKSKKVEGIIRNFLFTNSFGGFLLRILNKRPFAKVVTFIDNLTIPIFGESDIYLIAQKK